MADQNTNWRTRGDNRKSSKPKESKNNNKKNRNESNNRNPKNKKNKRDYVEGSRNDRETKWNNNNGDDIQNSKASKPDLSQKELFPSLRTDPEPAPQPTLEPTSDSSWVNLAKKGNQKLKEDYVKDEPVKAEVSKQTEVLDWTDRPKNETPIKGPIIDYRIFNESIRYEREYRQLKKSYHDELHDVILPPTEEEESELEIMRESEYWDRKYQVEVEEESDEEYEEN